MAELTNSTNLQADVEYLRFKTTDFESQLKKVENADIMLLYKLQLISVM